MAMNLLRIAVAALAVALLFFVLQDVFEVMLLPRRVQRRVRLVTFYYRVLWRAWTGLAPAGPRRGGYLSHFGALSMILLFSVWATALILGFGLLSWSLQGTIPGIAYSPLPEQLYVSGVTFFTLGYGDVVPHSGAGRVVSVLEAGIGIGFIAVVISYLPVIHQFFSRREAHVMQLDGRAGSPPTAAVMLTRHAEIGDLVSLDQFLREWEVWGSELLESHLSYPMLAYYRSQHENQSWLSALGCVMDTCALVLVGIPDLRPLQARLTFTMARQVLVEMAQSFGVEPSRYSGGDRLDTAAYDRLEELLHEAGVNWDGGPDARETLAALRATYEPLLDGLSRHLLAPLSGWLPDGARDNWERGHRGMIASRLVEELSTRVPSALRGTRSENLSRKLLRRLRTEEDG